MSTSSSRFLRRLLPLALALLVTGAAPVGQAKTTIKLATLAPDGSAWEKALEEMRAQVSEGTGGDVRIRIYPGGVAGDDSDMVRKIRINQLNAAAVTTNGLAGIDPWFNVFSIPLFFDSYDEFLYVLEKMTPELTRRIEEQGFQLLHWGHAGWVHLFATEPIHSVDDLRKVKMFTWAGDDRVSEVWKENGFNPVPLSSTDIMVSLQTGMIQAIPTTPYAAVAMQWYRHTPYMMGLGVAPLMGGTIVSQKTWDKLSPEERQVFQDAADNVAAILSSEVPKLDADAVKEMESRGVTVVNPRSEEERAEWETAARSFAESMKKATVPPDAYDMAVKFRDEFRNSQ